jgi:hypothetical protein
MKSKYAPHVATTCEQTLAEALQGVVSELRLIEPTDFVAFFRTGQLANLANVVNSSTELYYLPGTLAFGMSGDVELKWGGPPRIFLDMELHSGRVQAYFRLMLDADEAGIEMNYIAVDGQAPDLAAAPRVLVDALDHARLKLTPLSDRTADIAGA